MAHRATGQVIAPNGKQRSWALRFRAYGKRRFLNLGRPEEGWDRHRAEAELRHVLADVERDIWQPPRPSGVVPSPEVPTFHGFASEWLANREPELRPKTVASYRWQLTDHLLPHFAGCALDAITAEEWTLTRRRS
jgi:integrase